MMILMTQQRRSLVWNSQVTAVLGVATILTILLMINDTSGFSPVAQQRRVLLPSIATTTDHEKPTTRRSKTTTMMTTLRTVNPPLITQSQFLLSRRLKLYENLNDDNDNGLESCREDSNIDDSPSFSLFKLSSTFKFVGDVVGIAVQPIVWISLWSVGTTGHGLPAGPFGLVGAIEGISYLIVVGFVVSKTVNVITEDKNDNNDTNAFAVTELLSAATLVAALLVVIKLQADQGCIPNAKPILDYSAYVRVCDSSS
jgi:hypothetical protein